MITRYRLVFRNGQCGAWTSDYEQIRKNYDFFFPLAIIEKREF